MKQMEEIVGVSFTLLFLSFITGMLATAYGMMFSLLAYSIENDTLWNWASFSWIVAGCASIAFATMLLWIFASMRIREASARKR